MPRKSVIEDNLFVLVVGAGLSIGLQGLCYYIWPGMVPPSSLSCEELVAESGSLLPDYKWTRLVGFSAYLTHFIFFLTRTIDRLNRYALKWGCLNEMTIGRDR